MVDLNCLRNPMARINPKALLKTILNQFECHPRGLHGISHWARVRMHGLEIGRENGADLSVVEIFAFLHDSRRQNEHRDPDHGKRAAAYATRLNGSHFSLDQGALGQLIEAIEGHSQGRTHADPTIQTCWDADRLDLVRLNIDPDPYCLSPIASQRISRAWELAFPNRNDRSSV